MAHGAEIESAHQDLESRSPALEHDRAYLSFKDCFILDS